MAWSQGTALLLLADAKRGIALQRSSVMTRIADAIFSGHGREVDGQTPEEDLKRFAQAIRDETEGTHMNAVETKGLTKHFGPVQALSGLDLAVPAERCTPCWGSTELESPRRSKFSPVCYPLRR